MNIICVIDPNYTFELIKMYTIMVRIHFLESYMSYYNCSTLNTIYFIVLQSGKV